MHEIILDLYCGFLHGLDVKVYILNAWSVYEEGVLYALLLLGCLGFLYLHLTDSFRID